ncbi:MAG: asparagine synthase (glutamine-hydrolyzing) [Candidatus Omnitrophica bacterium]|nr:asparagine synthase (glutamine-hydrolyzing) [Candidatus Omnitrophota bacterium]
MCGISGVAFRDPLEGPEEELLKSMAEAMRHRGPDDEGFYKAPGIGLAMRRLSIIDLEGGRQPLTNEDGTVQVILNGEIYNFQELTQKLEGRGHRFQTRSDTEAIAHLYEEYGDRCVHYLRGMFAFALWDVRRRRLLLARDRVGKKPLHYCELADKLIFASEIKSILADPRVPRDIDPDALDQFLTFEYIPGERTIFKAVRRLLPGHFLIWEGGRLRTETYWEPDFTPENGLAEGEWIERLEAELCESVRLRLVSDVPLGVLLSGGIDSSMLVALMRKVHRGKIRTFSVGFQDASYDELPYARLVAGRFGTQHEETILKADVTQLVPELVRYFDEPFADVSAIPTYLVSKMARRHVTAALGGDGGDELFGGYDTYLAQKLAGAYERIPGLLRGLLVEAWANRLKPQAQKKGVVNRIKRYVEGFEYPRELGHARWMAYLTPGDKEKLYTSDFRAALYGRSGYEPMVQRGRGLAALDPLARAMAVDFLTYLTDDILVKVDRMSMAASLEVRAPFLDQEVVGLVHRMPSHLKVRGFKTKYILRQLARRHLPREIIQKPKQGFSIPVKNWLCQELKAMMMETLSKERVQRHSFFNPEVVSRWMHEHLSGTHNHAHRLWPLMMFELWREAYLMPRNDKAVPKEYSAAGSFR